MSKYNSPFRLFPTIQCGCLLAIGAALLTPTLAAAAGAAPVVEAIPDQSIVPSIVDTNPKTIGARLTFKINATDPEADPLFYRIDQVTRNGQTLASLEKASISDSTGDFSWGVRTSQVGEYTIRFLVKDCRPVEGASDCSGNATPVTVRVTVQKPQICKETSATCTFLKAHDTGDEAGAAGSGGDFYMAGDHNKDVDIYHAAIGVAALPQLDFMDKLAVSDFTIHPGYRDRGYDSTVFPGKVMIGNSSTAYTTGAYWSGHVRHDCMGSQGGVNSVYRQYINNHHMWYPEHQDHDLKDQHHAKIPYCSASQGSSGTELDEVGKFVRTLAAFKKPVKDRLRSAGLLIPIVQMISRRTRVASDAAYLTGVAHPNAFNDASNQDAMVQMAYGINPGDIPPIAEIEIVDHGYKGTPGVDYFSTTSSELFFASPASVAFIYRGKEYTKKIIASARKSYDLNQRPLTYHWAVLRGSPEGVRITPLLQDHSVVEIAIDYHPETTIEGSTRLTNLVEVGAFVHNGAYYSPPAFITSFSLAYEKRSYDGGRIQQIEYIDQYVFPGVSTKPSWVKDVFHYSANNSLSGWTRHYANASTKEFDAEGHCQSCAAYTASGRVAFSGQGLPGVIVSAVTYDGSQAPYHIAADSNGNFSFPGLPDGGYQFRVAAPPRGYVVYDRWDDISGANKSGLNLEYRCATGWVQQGALCVENRTISGKVMIGGEPLAGITVTATGTNGSATGTTAADGSYVLGLSSLGSFTVSASNFNYDIAAQGWQNPVTLSSGTPRAVAKDFAAVCSEGAIIAACREDLTPPAPPVHLRIM